MAQLLLFALQPLTAAKQIDGAVFRRAHEPGPGLLRDARLRPLLQCGDQGVLGELFGKADVAHDARQPGDQPGGLDPPDGIDGPMCVCDYGFVACARRRSPCSRSSGV